MLRFWYQFPSLILPICGLDDGGNYNQLTQTNGPSGIISYDYDGRGNLWREVDGMDVTTYSYDARDRLLGANLPDSTVLAYAYDFGGRRVQQTVNGSSTNYLWDEFSRYGDVVAEINQSNAVLASYTLAGGRLLSQTRSGATSYYLPDAQGSTRLLADLNGGITDTYDYRAFGETVAQTGTTTNSYRYTAQQHDELTDLYYLRARYYSPGLGRFLSRDTWHLDMQNPVEWNRYVYVANNPVKFIDPSGLSALVDYAMSISQSAIATIKATVFSSVVKTSIAALVEGGVYGIAGYVVGLAVYNYYKSGCRTTQCILDGGNLADLGEAIFLASVINLGDTWIQKLATDHFENFSDPSTAQADNLIGRIIGFPVLTVSALYLVDFLSDYLVEQGYGTLKEYTVGEVILLIAANWTTTIQDKKIGSALSFVLAIAQGTYDALNEKE